MIRIDPESESRHTAQRPSALRAIDRFFGAVPLLFVLLVTACIPATLSYYRPASTGADVVRAICPPVESFILFERDGVIVGAKALEYSPKELWIWVTFEVPEGKVVDLLEQDVKVFDVSRNNWTGELAGVVNFSLPGETKKKLLSGATLYGKSDHAYYKFRATLPMQSPATFFLRLPKFSVNTNEVTIPEIEFTRETEFLLATLNC